MRYRLPDECAGVTHAGLVLDRAPDGTVEAEEGAASALAAHGLVPIEPDDPTPTTKPPRGRSHDRRMLR